MAQIWMQILFKMAQFWMPFNIVEIIRKEAAPYSDVNVVALTANFANEALHECNRVHMQGVLPKPIDLGLLVQTITQFGTPKDLKEIH